MTLESVINKLRSLNEKVPKPLRKPTTEEIELVEDKIGRKLHPDLKFYLLEASDITFGALEPVIAVNSDPRVYLPNVANEAWDYGVPKDLTPICEDNADYFCLNIDGEVVFWSQDGITDEKWEDLATWIHDVWIGENM